MIHLLYFGPLREQLGCERETLPWAGGDTTALLALLRARGAPWQQALAPERLFRIVVNQRMAYGALDVPQGAEVGLLPPVTGG